MEQEDITKIYETLAPMAGDYANAQAEQIGQAQRSMGTLAGQTMGATTSGLGNYTYNRLMRPQIDVMRDEILVEGYRNQLNRTLSDAYKTAQKNYNRRSGGGGSSSSSASTSTGVNGWSGEIETEETSKDVLYLTGSEAYNITSNYDHKLSKGELEKLSGRPMTDKNYKVYEALYEKRYKDAAELSKNGD